MLQSQSFCSRTQRDWEFPWLSSFYWRCRANPVAAPDRHHAQGEQYHPSKLRKECCLDRPSSAPSQLDCVGGEKIVVNSKNICILVEKCSEILALPWTEVAEYLQEQSSYGRQPILLLIAITSQNFPICYFMWFWPPTILEVNFKATSRGSPSSFSLANSDKVSLRQFHLILVTMSMVYTSLLRWQLRWSSIKILHNVAKYTSVVKNYQTIYKYLSDIYFFELSIFLD